MKTVTIESTGRAVIALDTEDGACIGFRKKHCNPAALAQLVADVEGDGYVIDWANSTVAKPEPKDAGYTEAQARAYVAEHSDEDEHDEGTLERVFAALAGRNADDADRAEGLWSHCVQLA